MSKKKWCPLTGNIEFYDNLIMRARELWGVKTHVVKNIAHCYLPDKQQIEKARKIYDRWDELQRDHLRLEMVQDYLGLALDTLTQNRKGYLQDILILFSDLKASELEIFSIMAIYEARLSKNPAWPLELLALAEKYTPDVELGRQRRREQKTFGAKRWIDSDINKQRSEWLKLGKEYRAKYPNKKTHRPRWIAMQVHKKLQLPEKRLQTIYKYLLKNNV